MEIYRREGVMLRHPEQKPNEVYLGNTIDGIKEHLSDLKTIRLGKQAYDLKGIKIKSPTAYKPIFISKDEYQVYDRIMTERCRIARS